MPSWGLLLALFVAAIVGAAIALVLRPIALLAAAHRRSGLANPIQVFDTIDPGSYPAKPIGTAYSNCLDGCTATLMRAPFGQQAEDDFMQCFQGCRGA
jgi:hypothetical protein